jgi:hypothetical protein
MRHFIVESVEARVQPTGGGRRKLPDALVEVRIVAADPAAQRALRAALDEVQAAVIARLQELRCDVPAGFRVQVAYLKRPPAGWPADRQIVIDYPQPAAAATATPLETPALTLTVLRGAAAQDTYVFTTAIVRVGRSQMPHDDRGRTRRNDVAFLENGDEDSMTVTRGHCEIRFSRGHGGYRVFDEGSANGTRLVRGGDIIEVPANDPMGVAIQDDDELQFGNAAVRVAIGGPSPAE